MDAYRASCGNPKSGLMFPGPTGAPINPEALALDVIRPAFAAAGLPWYGWHGFRRGLASNLYRLGVPDKVIQQILRHANVSTTARSYIKTVARGRRCCHGGTGRLDCPSS
jgi:integrase